jgi:hypothetical protein
MIRTSIFFFLLVLISSCQGESFDSKEGLVDYITQPKNGYFQEKEINGYKFSLLYRPTDLLVAQELNDSTDVKQVQFLRDKYNDYLYFNLSMSYNDQELLNGLAGDHNKFGTMVNQLAFDMDQKVHLFTEKKDTIEIADFIYPRMYGMSRSTDILFVFPKEKVTKSEFLNFTIEDLGSYTGEIRFKIESKKIKNQPQIKY